MTELYVLFGMVVGFVLTRAYDLIAIAKETRELEARVKERLTELKEKMIPSRIEQVNGSLFLYNRDTNEFLGQGKDLTELESNVKLKYPNKLFNVPADELALYEKE